MNSTPFKLDISSSSKEEVLSKFKKHLAKLDDLNCPPKPKPVRTTFYQNNKRELADRNPALAIALSYR